MELDGEHREMVVMLLVCIRPWVIFRACHPYLNDSYIKKLIHLPVSGVLYEVHIHQFGR